MTVLFDQVARNGVHSSVYTDADHRTPIIRASQNCAAIVADNRRAAAAYQREMDRNKLGLRKIASIPFVVWKQLEQIGIVKGAKVIDEKAFLALLSDPDLRGLRCDNGARLA